MNCIFLRRGYGEIASAPTPTPIAVTITGTGNSTYCYATINDTKYYGAGTYEVMAGDKITFGVYGRSTTYTGKVTIDGTDVLKVTNQSTQTYEWTVPDGVTAIAITMSYTSSSYQRRGTITVTTTKGGGGSGGGSTPSEYAVTIASSNQYFQEMLEEGYISATLGTTSILQAGTYTAKNGTTLTLTTPTDGFTARATVNGSVVKTATTGTLSYSHTISSTTSATFSVNESQETVTWAITTS